jgi:hypothetical protein
VPVRIVVLADIAADGATVLDPAALGEELLSEPNSEPVVIAGAAPEIIAGEDEPAANQGVITLARTSGTNEPVLEITGGARITLENIAINGKTSGNRALKVAGAGTKVTLGDGTVVTGKKTDGTGGSGIWIGQGAEVEMTGTSIVTGCEESAGGPKGAVCVEGTLTMNGGAISDNTTIVTAGYANGGGVTVSGTGSLIMAAGAVISGNTATNSGPGGQTGGSGVTGAGVYSAGKVTMKSGAVIRNNIATGNTGIAYAGGVYVNGNGSTFVMEGGEISGNKAVTATMSLGGGVYVRAGTFTMENGIIHGNEADTNAKALGGGVYISSTFIMEGGVISGNKAEGKDAGTSLGGGVYQSAGTFTMNGGIIYGKDVTISDPLKNTAPAKNGEPGSGAAFYKETGTVTPSGLTNTDNTIVRVQ